MPILGPVLGGQIQTKFSMFGMVGASTPQLSMAVGNGIINAILATNVYSGATFGTGPGAGVGTGKVLGLIPPVCGNNISLMMAAKGFSGAQMMNTAMAIGMAFAEHITAFGVVTSAGAPTAIGSGTGPIIGLAGPMIGQQISMMMLSMGMTGAQSLNMAMAIGDGIALSMATAIVQTVIVGVPAPPLAGPYPMAGVETGKLI